jgi:perosamine synthetase
VITHSKPCILDSDRRAVDHVLASGMIAQGSLVHQFEDEAAAYLGVRGGVATASGTAALTLALKALRIAPLSEVILPTYVCRSVAEAVVSAGATPVLCDVSEEWNMTPETVAPLISSRTAAIIVVHVFGIPADTSAFKNFGIPIIEDCCQAFGARVRNSNVGTIGSIGVFSFHATKCLATGEGGLAVSNDKDVVRRMRSLRDGASSRVDARVASPMTDMQAALGLSQLSQYNMFLNRRKAIADLYFAELSDCSCQLPTIIRQKSIFFRFPVRVRGDFDLFRQHFNSLDIQVRRGVDDLLHREVIHQKQDFPLAERLYTETVSLPIYPALKEEEARAVIQACRKVWRS